MSRIPLQSISVNRAGNEVKRDIKKLDEKSEQVYQSILYLNDSIDKEEISSFHPYIKDIMDYVYNVELDYMMDIDLFNKLQDSLTFDTRCLLVDWIIDIHHKLELTTETLYLTINIIDRILCHTAIPKSKLQLLGITSLFISCKYEEVYSPSIKTFIGLGDGTIADSDLKGVEKYILQVLDYKIDFPSPLNFLRLANKADNYNPVVRNTGKYIYELTYFFEEVNRFRYSMRAVVSMYISRKINDLECNSKLFWYYTGHKEEDIADCLKLTWDYLIENKIHEFVRRKYLAKRYYKVAKIVDRYIKENLKK